MKKLLFLIFLLPLFALAQQKELLHTVAPKESLTSIGRMYHINGRVLAEYNNIDYDKGLSIGQILKIPVTSETTVPKNIPAPQKNTSVTPNGSPIYHKVTQGEGLYGISRNYQVSIAQIKNWNNLSSDALTLDMNLIVGFTTNKPSEPITQKAETNVKPAVTETPKKAVVETPKKEVAEVVKKTTEPIAQPKQTTTGSVFETLFTNAASKNENGLASVFKSTSGWEDGKYYCLHNDAPAGTILKISNPQTNKTIYAKVLDVIPELSNNKNNTLIVSNAAASALGVINEADFEANIQY